MTSEVMNPDKKGKDKTAIASSNRPEKRFLLGCPTNTRPESSLLSLCSVPCWQAGGLSPPYMRFSGMNSTQKAN